MNNPEHLLVLLRDVPLEEGQEAGDVSDEEKTSSSEEEDSDEEEALPYLLTSLPLSIHTASGKLIKINSTLEVGA